MPDSHEDFFIKKRVSIVSEEHRVWCPICGAMVLYDERAAHVAPGGPCDQALAAKPMNLRGIEVLFGDGD